MKEGQKVVNEQPLEDYLAIFDSKIDEYYISCLPPVFKGRKDLPFQAFNVLALYKKFYGNLVALEPYKLAYKLIDIKLNFCYLKTTHRYFYRGATLIVGNNEIEKLNPNTFSKLQENHYRVYLISILIEQILDLLQIIFFDELKDSKEDKWGELVKKIAPKFKFTAEEAAMISGFKAYRTAEFHKYSKVRGFLSKERWNHFQDEERVLEGILKRIG